MLAPYPHVTDGGLLEELLRRHGVDDPEGNLRAVVEQRFVAMTRDYVQGNPAAVREIPGATALLRLLRYRADCRVAIATGGWRETALLKLHAAGFDLDVVGRASAYRDHADCGATCPRRPAATSPDLFRRRTVGPEGMQ
jgi:hypothetical protein